MLETALIVIFAILTLWLLVTAVTAIWFIRELVKMNQNMQDVNDAIDRELTK